MQEGTTCSRNSKVRQQDIAMCDNEIFPIHARSAVQLEKSKYARQPDELTTRNTVFPTVAVVLLHDNIRRRALDL